MALLCLRLPRKKVYFNWNTGKAEKCNFCYPRIEAGLPTVCSETCVGRLRHLGIVLHRHRPGRGGGLGADEHDLLEAQLDLMLDPEDPDVREAARRDGIADDWIEAARRSPIYAMCKRWRIALPLHPEYRTLPMVWYVPPLAGREHEDDEGNTPTPKGCSPRSTRCASRSSTWRASSPPVTPSRCAGRCAGWRRCGGSCAPPTSTAGSTPRSRPTSGWRSAEMEEMFRMVAIGDYDDRYVVPKRHGEVSPDAFAEQGSCGIDFVNAGRAA